MDGASARRLQRVNKHRRGLLKIAVASSALFGILSVNVLSSVRSIDTNGSLSVSAAQIFRKVAAVVLDGSLDANPQARVMQLDRHIGQLEKLLANLPEATRSDLSLLLSILANATGRHALAQLRTPWPMATIDEVASALQMMRTSTLKVRQQAYHALRDLTNAAFYAEPTAWKLMGYPGPSEV